MGREAGGRDAEVELLRCLGYVWGMGGRGWWGCWCVHCWYVVVIVIVIVFVFVKLSCVAAVLCCERVRLC